MGRGEQQCVCTCVCTHVPVLDKQALTGTEEEDGQSALSKRLGEILSGQGHGQCGG